MKSLLVFAASAVALMSVMVSCDNSDEVGGSLNQADMTIVVDSAFTVTGHSVEALRVVSRTTTQLLGAVDAKGYGTLRSDVVTQFMPAADIDTVGIKAEDIDSLRIVFSIPNGGYVGDSIAPLGIEIYRLNKQLPSPIYSDFDPTGYYDPSSPLASTVYACNSQGYNDSIQALDFRGVIVNLPVELGRELYSLYRDNPATFQTPSEFAKHFAGLYIRNSYGNGCIIRVSNTIMQMFYHTDDVDDQGKKTVKTHVGNYFGVTPEIVTNNNITYTGASELTAMANAGDAIISAPAGLDVDIIFPAADIMSRYRNNKGTLSVINDLTFTVPVNLIENEYGIAPPPALLMVLSKDKEKFFINNSLPDNISSFTATYDAATGSYTFTGMREYIINLLSRSDITADDYTFTLTPVTINTTTESGYYNVTTYTTSVVPYIDTPAMARLDLKNAKIIFKYSNQSIKF